ncbi:hypothetical protein [Acinetobacter sp.]|uniref:hypothetical protein n=1 Tax=Acinetobacter sp. TaxID=472 RepID=UPI0035AE0EF5
MNKIGALILLLIVVWLGKLSFDLYFVKADQLNALNLSLNQQSQRVSALYDQLISMQQFHEQTFQENPSLTNTAKNNTSQNSQSKSNQPKNPNTQTSRSQQNQAQQNQAQQNSLQALNPTLASINASSFENQRLNQDRLSYVKDRLSLIQAMLQQQRISMALSQIQNLKQKLAQEQLLASSLNSALIAALQRDQNTITQYSQQRSEHLSVLQQQLQKIETQLEPVALDQASQSRSWSNWFKLQRVEQGQQPDLQQRALHYKEMQLQLLLAQQALYAGQKAFYRQQIATLVESLAVYPDATSQSVLKSLKNLDGIALNPPPQLSAITLLGDTP